jgi:ABC-type multidrug transport system ATPase subunit
VVAMSEVLEIGRVRHRFGALTALHGVCLTVVAGECVALLGPNGAGKTTVIGLATGLLGVQAGSVRVCGGDPRRAATRCHHLGVVQQSMGFPRTLTVGELVRGWAVRAGRSAAAAGPVLAEVGITELCERRAAKLSGGQQQRVALAMALVGDPDSHCWLWSLTSTSSRRPPMAPLRWRPCRPTTRMCWSPMWRCLGRPVWTWPRSCIAPVPAPGW